MSTDNHERMERVNELAVQARTDSTVIPALWDMVEKLVRSICFRYCRPQMSTHIYELDDLCQSAYFGFLKAIDKYDPVRGAFSSLLVYCIRQSCCAEIGLHGKRDALFDAKSMSAQLYHDGEGNATLDDTISDLDAEQSFDNVIEQMHNEQLRAALDECMAVLPQYQAAMLRARYYERLTLDAIGIKHGISKEGTRQNIEKALTAMRRPEHTDRLSAFWEGDIIAVSLKYTGFKFFKNYRYSSTEWAAEQLLLKAESSRSGFHSAKIP